MPEREIIKNGVGQRTIFFTGGTGFLGSYLAYRLLEAGHYIIFLVRPKRGKSGKQRIDSIIAKIGSAVSTPDKVKYVMTRYGVVEGDITKKELGLSPPELDSLKGNVADVWHCAASLSFREKDRAKNVEVNVQGTAHCLDFAKRIGARRLIYLSTAFVQHHYGAVVYEDQLIAPKHFHNSYEETKFLAEELLRKPRQSNEPKKSGGTNNTQLITPSTIIFRPSIVLGDKNFLPPRFYDYYAFLSTLAHFEDRGAALPLILPYDASATINFIPIHRAISWMIDIAKKEEDCIPGMTRVFHIVNPKPPRLRTIINVTRLHFKVRLYPIRAPRFFVKMFFFMLQRFGFLHPSLRNLALTLHYFGQYLIGESTYDIGNVKKLLGEEIGDKSLVDSTNLVDAIDGFRSHRIKR